MFLKGLIPCLRLTTGLLILAGGTVFSQTGDAGTSTTKVLRIGNDTELRQTLRNGLTPGTRLEIAAGTYAGGLSLENLKGEKGRPIVITAADPANPPQFTGGGSGIHLRDAFYVELRNLHFQGCSENGINVDDGGTWQAKPRGLVLEGLRISAIGPKGNHDGIKLSGLSGFRVENCVVENWGTGSGSGIDMVGCHEGLITGCTFRHQPGADQTGGNGVQIKGGSSKVTVRKCRFEHAGQRALNLGGSTGVPFFRPPLASLPPGAPRCEASALTVEGNTITGSQAAFAFVGVDGAVVRFNTIYRPGKWLARILQETRDPSFVPCRNGVLSDNLILFLRDNWSENGVNTGGGTAPDTFRFQGNFWYCLDSPAHSRPRLPVAEEGGVYGVDPMLDPEAKDGESATAPPLKPGSPAADKGAGALPPPA